MQIQALSYWINSKFQPIRFLDPDCWYKFTYLMANSADPDQLASSEANWSGSTLFAKAGYIRLQQDYYLFNISGKDVFCLAFYFKWKYFVLIDHILSETIFRFCFCVLFSNFYSKIKFTAKNWSNLCNFYSKVIFLDFLYQKIFFIFLCWILIIDVSQQHC